MGEDLNVGDGRYYNPDVEARSLLEAGLVADQREANGWAWQHGLDRLRAAIDNGTHFTFETTLAGSTICSELRRAGELANHEIVIWYVGLASVEDNIRRVRERTLRGGHDIPEEAIRRRFTQSPINLVGLMDVLMHLYVFDNTESAAVDSLGGTDAAPLEVLRVVDRTIERVLSIDDCPEWAQPIRSAAHAMFDGGPAAVS